MNDDSTWNLEMKRQMPIVEDIVNAQKLLAGIVRKTPLQISRTFSGLTGTNLFLKLECLQVTGSFKVRGAFVKISRLSDKQASHGVIAASAGNHAQGVAYAPANKEDLMHNCNATERFSRQSGSNKVLWSQSSSAWRKL